MAWLGFWSAFIISILPKLNSLNKMEKIWKRAF
jgi:hypothetical protein